MRVIVTGGLGFIGSAVVRMLIEQSEHEVLNVDVETYAATRGSVESVAENDRYDFVGIDITDADAVRRTFDSYAPDAVLHLAAESHVDRSIDGPDQFVQTNVVGTCNLLNAAVEQQRRSGTEDSFRFIHVSTDEVLAPSARRARRSTSQRRIPPALRTQRRRLRRITSPEPGLRRMDFPPSSPIAATTTDTFSFRRSSFL